MTNSQKLYNSFATALNIELSMINDDLKYQSITQWDSISHMILVSQIEEDFGVSLDANDVIDMSTVEKAKKILTRLGINFKQ